MSCSNDINIILHALWKIIVYSVLIGFFSIMAFFSVLYFLLFGIIPLLFNSKKTLIIHLLMKLCLVIILLVCIVLCCIQIKKSYRIIQDHKKNALQTCIVSKIVDSPSSSDNKSNSNTTTMFMNTVMPAIDKNSILQSASSI